MFLPLQWFVRDQYASGEGRGRGGGGGTVSPNNIRRPVEGSSKALDLLLCCKLLGLELLQALL